MAYFLYTMSMDCVFCAIVEKNDPHHEILWQDAKHLAFLSAGPAQPGHTLVIPRAHTDYAFDLSPESFASLMEASRRLAIPLKAALSPERVELGIGGYEVPHVHVHLVPSSHGPDMCQPARTDTPAEELRRMGDILREAFKDVPGVA
jgi:histidine triad (HIT) family protein